MSADVPIIDIGELSASEPATTLERLGEQVRDACLGTGFFHLTGHGVPDMLVEDVFAANRSFHASPMAEKLRIKLNRWHRGYEPFATSKLLSSARFEPAAHANQLESFFLRHEVSADDPGYLVNDLMGPNQWPDDPAFRDAVRAYEGAVVNLGLRLLPVFSLAVNKPADFFDQFFAPPSTALRLIHYPPQAAAGTEGLFGISPHTDYGFFTILAQDDVGGLEVQRVDGSWIEVPHMPGSFVLNIGDNLARWTNDVFNSTPHRVINRSPTESRYSVGMFFDPNIEAVVRCLDGFADDETPPKYPPVRYGDYFRMRLDSNFPDRADAASR